MNILPEHMRYLFTTSLDKRFRTCSFGGKPEDVGGAAPAEAVARHDRGLVYRGRLEAGEGVCL